MNISFQKMFYAIATTFALFAILVLAKTVLIPLAFALLIAFILLPMVKRFERWGMSIVIATFSAIIVVTLLLAGGMTLFSIQLGSLSSEFENFKDQILLVFADVTLYVNKNINIVPNLGKDEIFNRIKGWLVDSTGSMVRATFSNTANILTGLLLTVVFTFLILIYRNGFTLALVGFAAEDKRANVLRMYKSVQLVGQKYLVGMLLLILIIGMANSIGLWIIGIDHPFLFGFLGAVLSIVPYVGTVSGAIIPALYAIVSFSSPGMALAIIILFWFVQVITDNYLSPRIVGGSLQINALTAILSLIVGAAVWGVAGMILFLPFSAMLKVVCQEYTELQPIALLIGDQNSQTKEGDIRWTDKWWGKFKKIFNKDLAQSENQSNKP